MTEEAESKADDKIIIIYALPGSQFVAKVLTALDQRKIPHYVQFVPLDVVKRKKMMPSGGHLVPEMTVEGAGIEDRLIVKDSEVILHWIDDNYKTGLFPTEQASELSKRASDKTLAAMVWYYNWVDDDGYKNSMLKTITEMTFPSWMSVFCFTTRLVDYFLAKERIELRDQVKETLGLEDSVLDDKARMREILVEELKYFQSFLVADGTQQPYLLPGDQPTAADFSVYAQMERLVGGPKTASDIPIYPSIQELKDSGSSGPGSDLKRLWEWHDNMREKCPVQFKGKRPPAKK